MNLRQFLRGVGLLRRQMRPGMNEVKPQAIWLSGQEHSRQKEQKSKCSESGVHLACRRNEDHVLKCAQVPESVKQ